MNHVNRRRFLLSVCLGLPAASLLTAARADAIHDAVAQGSLSQVKQLLGKNRSLLEARNDDHLTPLLMAVALGKSEIAHFLVQLGADVNARKADGNSPLFDAAHLGDVKTTLLLIRHKADVNAQNKKGETPLFYTVIYDQSDVARVLLEHKADVDSKQEDGKTPLLLALKTDKSRLVPILIAHGADLRMADNQGDTPLLSALSGVSSSLTTSDSALLSSIPISLQLSNTSLHDAFVQLFAQAKQKAAVSESLTTPVSMTVRANFGDALSKLLHKGASAAAMITIGSGIVHLDPPPETWPVLTKNPRYQFYEKISLPVLIDYLARAVTHAGLCSSSPEPSTLCFEDDLRMLTALGAKFVGRAAYAWVPPDDEEGHFRQAKERAAKVAAADPEIILQACVFEAVYEAVGKIPVPDWVFKEFSLPVEHRNFNYSAMLYDGNKFHNHWTQHASVPDMSKIEMRLYFYYRARRYIDSGFESIHFGQVGLMDENDPNHVDWKDMLSRVRRYAAHHARRSFVFCDAHTHGIAENGVLLFDFHAWPLRPHEIAGQPEKCDLVAGFGDSIIGHSQGGLTPSGWYCRSLPYIVEVDNFGSNGKAGQGGVGLPWVWGYDEISWFAHQSSAYRNAFLRYAWNWVEHEDPIGHFQPCTRRNLADPVTVNGISTNMYQANKPSHACPQGFGQEDTLKSIWL